MRTLLLKRSARYGAAVLGVVAAALVRLALEPIFGEDSPLMIFLLSVMLVSWYGGLGPGLLATFLSILVGDYLFIMPKGVIFGFTRAYDPIRIGLFAFFGVTISVIITRLRNSVSAERETAERFRLLVEGAKDYAIFMLDPQGRVASWNSGAERLMGYQESEIIGRDFTVFFTPEDLERGRPCRVLKLAAEDGRHKEEGLRTRKDGGCYWANVLTTALHDDEGRLRGFVKVARDITERKQAEDTLRKSKQFVQRIVEVSPSLIYIYDVGQGRNVFVNRGIAAALGYDPAAEAQEGNFVRSVMHPDDWPRFLRHLGRFADLCDDEVIEFEYRMRMPNGDWRWFYSRDKVFTRGEDGVVREVIGTATDITERKHAQETAQFLNSLNRTLRPLADPEEIKAAATKALCEHLGADRCAYAEVEEDGDFLEITGDYNRGGPRSMAGRFSLDDLGPEVLRLMRVNLPAVIDDIEAGSPAGRDVSTYRREDIRALVCVPLHKNGHYVARMAVSQKTPRHWLREEVALVTIVANRCWESVQRARAVRNLKESEERYRAFITNSSEAIWRYELEQPIPITLPEDEQIDMLFRYGYLAECNDAMARMYGYEKAEEIVGARIGDILLRSDPKNLEYLRAFRRAGYRLTDVETHEIDRYGNTKFFLNNQAAVIENGAIVRGWGMQRDITEKKQVERALRESEERLRRITEATQDALWEIDLKTNQLWWSEGARPLFGRSPGELEIGLEDWYGGIHPEDVDRVRAKFHKFMSSAGICSWSDEYRFRRADGSYIYIFDRGRKFCDAYGKPALIAGAMVDITERKRAEEALRESEERFAKAFRASPDGLVISRLSDGVVLEVNDSFVSQFGFDRNEVIGKRTVDVGLYSDPQDRERALQILKDRHYVRDFEFVAKRKSGEPRLINFSAEPLELGGKPCWLTIVRDITERKQAEEALRESEERFEKAFRASPDGLIITRMSDGAILEVNDRWAAMFGYNRADVIGRNSILDDFFVDPGDRQRILEELKGENNLREFEALVRRKTGESRLVTLSAERLELGGERCLLTIVHDISERKRAEEALRNSEEQARRQLAQIEAIYATAPVGLCFVDAELRFISINERLAEINGRTVEEHLGHTVREVMPEAADIIEPIMRRVIKTGEPISNIEISAAGIRNPAVLRHFIASYYPIKNGGGRVLGINSVVVEITQRKKIEEERERLLGKEKEAREEAEAANRMKDEFLATISHELRTPLTSILGWARMLADGGLTKPQARHALDVIAQSAQSQTRLIEDILDTSRIITGRFKLDAHPVEVERIFWAAVDVIRPSAEAKGIILNAAVDDSDGVVFGDANRLQQALWNLLSNAVKFTNEGGRVQARLGRADGQIEITVTDTGVGVDPQFLPHVFERFRQADSASTREYGGLGLGLAIVRHIIEMHGGGVSASSPGKDQGATFKIRLPLASSATAPQLESRPLESEVKRMKEHDAVEAGQRLDDVRVLLVEDNPDTLDMLKFIFDECGAEVIAAGSVTEALNVLERWRPDALVSDIAMPDQDGYDLIRQLRARNPEQGGEIPAVAVTAYASAEDRVRVLAAGFQMHVAKPVDPDELIAVVASLTGHIPV
jgi:PAS domain S-box-containing protein